MGEDQMDSEDTADKYLLGLLGVLPKCFCCHEIGRCECSTDTIVCLMWEAARYNPVGYLICNYCGTYKDDRHLSAEVT